MRTSFTRFRVNPAIGCTVHSNKDLVSVMLIPLINWTTSVFKYRSFRTFNHYNETFFLYNENIPQAVALNSSQWSPIKLGHWISLGGISQLQFLRSSMPVRYATGSQKLKLRMRNVCWVRVHCKICKNSLHESWHANNQICIFLSLHSAAFLDFQNKNILYFLQLCLRPLSLRLLVVTVLRFLKPDKHSLIFIPN